MLSVISVLLSLGLVGGGLWLARRATSPAAAA